MAHKLSCSISRVQLLRARSEIGYFRLRPVLFSEADVQEYLHYEDQQRARAERAPAEAMRYAAQAREEKMWMRASIPTLKQTGSGVFYVFWSEGRRSKRVST